MRSLFVLGQAAMEAVAHSAAALGDYIINNVLRVHQV